MKKDFKLLSLILTLSLIVSLTAPMAYAESVNAVKAVPVQISLTVDGSSTSLWAYSIDGNAYFKLRDIAKVLIPTNKKFDISVGGSQVDLISGENYAENGTELAKLSDEAAAYPSKFSFLTNGVWDSILSYNVGGSNFVKLSDLAASLGFAATCDMADSSAAIKADSNISQLSGQILDNVGLSGKGNSYYLDDSGNVVITYNKGEAKTTAPIKLTPSGSTSDTGMTADEAGFYVSADKTAIAYRRAYNGAMYVVSSEDMGKTWIDSEIIAFGDFSKAYVGFITKNDGWLVLCSSPALGSEWNFIYMTHDGGKTWTQGGNPNTSDSRVLTGAGFSDNENGLMCFRFETSQLNICATHDSGKTWSKLDISVPEGFEQYYSATPLSPVFNGSNGLLPIELEDAKGNTKTIYFLSSDCGKTWNYDSSGK